MIFDVFLAAVAVIAAALAAVAGFGIGSLLTPVLAIQAGTKLAVAVVAIPHFAGSALRFWMLRRHVDRRVVLGFGVTSAQMEERAESVPDDRRGAARRSRPRHGAGHRLRSTRAHFMRRVEVFDVLRALEDVGQPVRAESVNEHGMF